MEERPYIVVFSTTTLDGRIASSTGYSKLSCKYDLARLRLLRGMVEGVMVGANTVLIDNPRLLSRYMPRTRHYYRIIVDGKLRIHPGLRVVEEEAEKTIILTATRNTQREKEMAEKGVKIHHVGENGQVDLDTAMKLLREKYGIRKILVEGGGILVYNLLRRRLVDEIRVTITGAVFGAGRSIVEDPKAVGFKTTAESPKLVLECVEKCPCGNCVHMVYRVTDRKCCPPRLEGGEVVEQCLSSKLVELFK